MIYQFRDERTGEIVELYYPMAEAPEIGSVIDGHLTRIPSRTENVVVPNVHFRSMQMPQNYKYAKKFDEWGTPVFDSKRELDECLAKANSDGECWAWS